MSDRPVVSVVMPFKDAAPWLETSARSVLAQTWDAVELVLVDDGGTDGSDRLAERVRAADPRRVRVVAHEGRRNRGIGPSRLRGLRAATGDLVACLDADDVWEPSHLQHEVGVLLAHPDADVVVCRHWAWRSWRGTGEPDTLSALPFAPGVVVDGADAAEVSLRNGSYAAATCSVVARRSLLGGWADALDRFAGMYEDQVLHTGLQLRGRVVLSGTTTAWYRQHPRSISAALVGDDPRTGHDVGRTAWLTWLLADAAATPSVRAVAERELAAVRARAGRQHPVPRVPRRPTAVLRAEGLAERVGLPTPSTAAARRVHDERLHVLLDRHAGDLRGAVLVLAAGPLDLPARSGADVRTAQLPPQRDAAGPDHPLAAQPSGVQDAVLVVDDRADGAWGETDLRHLRRLLSPGGVLLLVLLRLRPRVLQAVREAFGADAVRVDPQEHPGPPHRPLVVVRAVVPR